MKLLSSEKAIDQQSKAAFLALSHKVTNGTYFGHRDQRSAELHLIRGFTMSNMHHDMHHCVGEFLQHDFVVLQRSGNGLQCTITEVDLHVNHDLEHLFILPNGLNHSLFTTVITRYPHHRHAPYAPNDHFSPAFKNNYSIFTKPSHFISSLAFINANTAVCLDAIKTPYIYEIEGRSLFIYNFDKTIPTLHSLEAQVRLSCTIATTFEAK